MQAGAVIATAAPLKQTLPLARLPLFTHFYVFCIHIIADVHALYNIIYIIIICVMQRYMLIMQICAAGVVPQADVTRDAQRWVHTTHQREDIGQSQGRVRDLGPASDSRAHEPGTHYTLIKGVYSLETELLFLKSYL